MRQLDLSKTVYDLTEQYPELVPLLKQLGFLGVANPIARATLGRMTTIPQGCDKIGASLPDVIRKLEEAGFEVK